MDVPLPEQHIVVSVELDFGPIVGIEQDPIAHFDGSDTRTDSDGGSPREPPAH